MTIETIALFAVICFVLMVVGLILTMLEFSRLSREHMVHDDTSAALGNRVVTRE